MIDIKRVPGGITFRVKGMVLDCTVEMLAIIRTYLRDCIVKTSPETSAKVLKIFYETVNSPDFLADNPKVREVEICEGEDNGQ